MAEINLGGGNSNMFYLSPRFLEKWSNLTVAYFFEMQLVQPPTRYLWFCSFLETRMFFGTHHINQFWLDVLQVNRMSTNLTIWYAMPYGIFLTQLVDRFVSSATRKTSPSQCDSEKTSPEKSQQRFRKKAESGIVLTSGMEFVDRYT